MEWVETTGTNVEAATSEALNLLGIDASDAEIEVIETEEIGWFGRVKSPARVRARIKPLPPQAAADNRNRRSRSDRQDSDSRDRSRRGRNRRGSGTKSNKSSDGTSDSRGSSKDKNRGRDRDRDQDGGRDRDRDRDRDRNKSQNKSDDRANDSRSSSGGRSSKAAAAGTAAAAASNGASDGQGNKDNNDQRANRKEKTMEEFPVEEQSTLVKDFLEGLARLFDDSATVTVTDDEDNLNASVDGEDLGLLIGPKGQTLDALDEITRTVIQREANGRRYLRLNVDVDGYRERRREALVDFTKRLAEDVRESGIRKSLEPMRSSDRKVVHDTVSDIDGVVTLSEGNDPRRYVVIAPE